MPRVPDSTRPAKKADDSAEEVEVEVIDGEDEDFGDDEVEAELQNADSLDGDDGDALEHDASTSTALVAESTTSLAKTDPLRAYMREVQQHALLTRKEEHELAVRYVETGDVEAAARMVTANLRLVVKLAYEYRRAYRNMMDLIQEGNIGLMQAVKRFDPYRGVKLSSYAAWWIRAYMLRYILNNWRLVKLGTTQAQRKLFFNLNKEKAKLAAMGIEPTHEEIAQRLNVSKKEVVDMDRRLSSSDASLDAPVGDGEGRQTSRMELLPSTTEGPDVMTEAAQLSEIFHQQLGEFRETLSDKDLKIFDERMVAEEPKTLQELGQEFGVSRERVRQLEARIMKRLREFLAAQLDAPDEILQ